MSMYYKSFCPLFYCLTTLFISVEAQGSDRIVADRLSGVPLAGASVFDRHGKPVGISRSGGRMPYLSPEEYPATVRYMGYKEAVVDKESADTIFMVENPTLLPEVVVESRSHKLLHMLAYEREYSTLSTYTDTVFLFREKMVDFMINPDGKGNFKGWTRPRVLVSKSYYRFTDSNGLDSVSDRCNHHFSWSDWIGIVAESPMPPKLALQEMASDTVRGRYSATEIWHRRGDRVELEVDVLADTTRRHRDGDLSVFFHKGIDFDRFRVKFNFGDVVGDRILPADLFGYSFSIESNGRGHDMFKFNRRDQPFCVSTYGEVYVIDKEYITCKEASKWDRLKLGYDSIGIFEPREAPPLQPAINELIARVENVDHDHIRLALPPDRKLLSPPRVRLNVGQRVLQRLKGIIGIDHVNARRKWNRNWRDFRRDQYQRNKGRD